MRYAVMLLASLALASCGESKKTEDVTFTVKSAEGEDKSVKAKVTQDKESATFTSDEGTATFASGDAAAAAAKDVAPVYPGAAVLSTMKGVSDDGAGGMVVMSTGDSPDKVAAHYKQVIADRGMKVNSEITTGDSRMIGAGDDRNGMQVMIQPGEKGQTQITLFSGTKPK